MNRSATRYEAGPNIRGLADFEFDYVIHFDRKFKGGGYRLGVNRDNVVEITVGDVENENEDFAAMLLRKHQRFIKRRLRKNDHRRRADVRPPEPTLADARSAFEPLLRDLARQMGVPPWRLRFRRAATRWGSCSHRSQSIMLNLRAVHLPEELRRYLVVHELAHIRYLGHDRNFWAFVERFDPRHREHRKRLREEFGWLLD